MTTKPTRDQYRARLIAQYQLHEARRQYLYTRAELAQVNKRPDLRRGPYLAACRRALGNLRETVRREHIEMLRRERDRYRGTVV